jgi:hypothetical protein
MPHQKDIPTIPKLRPKQFIAIALYPKIDVILLAGKPDMPYDNEAEHNVRMLIKCFKNIPSVKFYELNIATEKVPGLDIPKSEKPLLSIWPATEEPMGLTFGAHLSIPLVIDKMLHLIAIHMSDVELEQMAQRINVLQEQEN